MQYRNMDCENVCIVLQAAINELEEATNYVERIVALKSIAEILKLLTDYKDLGEEIERNLAIADNVSNHKISRYSGRIKVFLTQQINKLEYAAFRL